jgi:hypothetical protein
MSGTSKSDASLQHDLISAPVQLVSSGQKQFGRKQNLGRRTIRKRIKRPTGRRIPKTHRPRLPEQGFLKQPGVDQAPVT